MLGWFSRRHEDKINRYATERTQIMYLLPENPRHFLDPLSRQEITRRVEWLTEKMGIVKEGIHGIARHSIGTGLTLQLNSDDPEWNAEAEADYLLYSLTKDRCDLAARRDVYTGQKTAVRQYIGRGESFCKDALNPRWNNEPCFQLFDTSEIRTPDEMTDEGQIYDGVKLGDFNEPIGYFACREGGKHDYIDASLMAHWYDPDGINQIRGQSAFSPVVDKLVDWRDMEKLVVQTAKTQNAIAIAVNKLAKSSRGAFGAIGNRGQSDGGVNTSALEKTFPGLVAYMGENGEAKMINHTSPNSQLEPFLSNLIGPDVFLALGVPWEFFWSGGKNSGQDRRAILARADVRFKGIADDLIYVQCNRNAYRFLAHRIETKKLRACKDPKWAAKMGWQQPARITVDNGRDGNLELQQLANGGENLRGMWDRRGKSYREEAIRQWLREWAEFLKEHAKMKQDMTPELSAIWDTIPGKWRTGMPGAGGSLQTTPPAEDDKTETETDPKETDPSDPKKETE